MNSRLQTLLILEKWSAEDDCRDTKFINWCISFIKFQVEHTPWQLLLFSGEAASGIIILFGLTIPGLDPTIYNTRGQHLDHHTIDRLFIFDNSFHFCYNFEAKNKCKNSVPVFDHGSLNFLSNVNLTNVNAAQTVWYLFLLILYKVSWCKTSLICVVTILHFHSFKIYLCFFFLL